MMKSSAKISNLFQLQGKREAERLYSIYLSRLLALGREHRAVEACRVIRRHAAKRKPLNQALFTYHFEIEGLCRSRDYRSAWRVLRRFERLTLGQQINLSAATWSSAEIPWFSSYHAPILYFLGKHRTASRLLEADLSQRLNGKSRSYEVLPYIYNAIATPGDLQEVTLYHIYRKLGKSLQEWRDWGRFIEGIEPQQLVLTGVPKEKLRRKPSLIRLFHLKSSKAETAPRIGLRNATPEIISALERFFPELSLNRMK
jgi:hypothetical protein